MSKYVKNLLQGDLEKKFEGTTEFVIVNTIGIDGNENNELRGSLREKNIKLTVVKNSTMIRALQSMGVEGVESIFDGSCTVAYGGDSVVDIAKELVDWSKKLKRNELKGAYVDGQCMDSEGAMALSKMPTRAELQATISAIATTPGAKLVGAITGPAGAIAGCLKSIMEKAEEAA